MKYNTIAKLSLCVLLLPHGSSDPERAFSLNKNAHAVDGFSVKEETLEAIRMVQDFIIRNNEVMNIEISKDLIEYCKVSWKKNPERNFLRKESQKMS